MFDLLISKYKIKLISTIEEKIQISKNTKDSALNELSSNIHLHLINNSYDLILKNYNTVRTNYWKQKEKELHAELIFSTVSTILEKIYYILIVYILFYANLSGNLSAGNIGAAYTNFERLRNQLLDMKKQVEATVKKATPILLQEKIYSNNSRQHKIMGKSDDGIIVDHLSFKAGEQYILKNISLFIPRGKKIALIGENGSGKTSLLRCIGGINTSYTGNIKLINICESNDSNRKNIMYATSSPKLFLENSVYDNVMMASENNSDDYKYDDILDLKKLGNKDVKILSGGEKQRINLLRQLMNSSTELYLLDEPTASLDNAMANTIMKYFFNLNKTVIYTTHDLSLASQADIIIELKKGEVFSIKNGKKFTKKNIEQSY